MDKPTGRGVERGINEVERLRGEVAAARAQIEKLTAQLGEQQGLSRRVERAREAWAQTVDALAQPIFMHDEKGCIVRANRAYADRAGVPVKNLTGKVYWKLFPVRDGPFTPEGPETGDTEFEFPLSPDEVFLVRSVGASARLPASWRLYIFQDITELKRAEAAARGSAQYAKSIVESSLVAIVAVDRDRRVMEFNPAAERAFGYRRDEVLGKPVNMLYADPAAGEAVRRVVLEHDGAVGEIVNRKKSGELFTSLLSAALLRDAEGKMLGVVGTSVDVTARKEAETSLRKALAEHELVFDNTAVGIAVARNRVIARLNRRFAEMLGYEKEELAGKSTEILYPTKADFDKLGEAAYPELAQGRIYRADVQFRRRDGSLLWVHLAGRALTREEEAGDSVWAVADISERKIEEGRLARSEAYFRGLVENSNDVTLVSNAAGVIQYASPSIERVLGYRPAECIGRSSFELVHPDDVARVRDAYQRVSRPGTERFQAEARMRHRDGTWCVVEGIGRGARDIGGDRIAVVNLHDMTEHRRAEQRLQESMQDAVAAIAAAVEMRDPYTAGHQRNSSNLAVAIAREMGLDAERVHGLRLAAAVHDIGNILIPVEILAKPGKLTEIEYAFVKTHPQAGHEILKDIDFPWPIAQIVLQHHELLDGSGYPRGLRGGEILLEARILVVANVVAAMTAHRAFLPAAGIDAALAEISRFRGTKFDPQAVDACVMLFREKAYSFEKR